MSRKLCCELIKKNWDAHVMQRSKLHSCDSLQKMTLVTLVLTLSASAIALPPSAVNVAKIFIIAQNQKIYMICYHSVN